MISNKIVYTTETDHEFIDKKIHTLETLKLTFGVQLWTVEMFVEICYFL